MASRVCKLVQFHHPIPPFSKQLGEFQLSRGREWTKAEFIEYLFNGMVSAENVVYIDNNS